MIKAVKDHVKVPVIGVSSIRDPEIAEQFLEEGIEDFVSMGRSWLCDENWGRKVQEGREKELRKCINCLRCFESLQQWGAAGMPPECSQNPRLAREKRYGELKQAPAGKKVVVVGGGPAGMCAAQTLALRGVKVVLMDDKAELGGTINYAKKPPLKERMQWIANYYNNEFERFGVEVCLNTKATADSLTELKPDAVIVATGSKAVIPGKIPGVKGEQVYTVEEVLGEKIQLVGKKVAVIGGGQTGLETAEFLCTGKNEVSVIEMMDKLAPNANQTNVIDVCGRLSQGGVKYYLSHALKEIKEGSVILEKLEDHTEVTISADAVILSLGYRPDVSLAEQLTERGIEAHVIGSAKRDGTIAPATRSGYEIGRMLFTEQRRISGFVSSKKDVENFGKVNLMKNQEGVYLAYLTDPAAIARILPPPLKPFPMPIVTLSVCHIKEPTFADDYYEAILGVYAMYGQQKGLYTISLILGGNGAEMATQCGRDNSGIPKKLGGEFMMRKNGDEISVQVTRRGTELVDITMKLGEYNNPMTAVLYQMPTAGRKTMGGGFYYMFDNLPDENSVCHFTNACLISNLCEYTYYSWEPGHVGLKLKSSVDDPWAELPINSVIGGAWANNDLLIQKMTLLEKVNADEVVPYLLTGRYDRTAFMEIGRV